MRRTNTVVIACATVILAIAATGCSSEQAAASTPSSATAATVQLAPENVITAGVSDIASGPTISGQLTPARKASVRAQVGGSIVALTVDRGQTVSAGAEIAKISSRDLETASQSAEAAVKSAEIALDVATAERQRTEALVKGGALAARDLEQARNAVSSAEAQVAAAKARQRANWQQLDDTSVKAPFAGIVSERPASLGDVVAPGAEIASIIDPSSMRLEALVPSDQIQSIQRGAKARFSIRGAGDDVVGTVDRISPSADPITRQVSIFITVPNAGGRLIAGLFAEGRVDTASRKGIVIPLSAVDETGPAPFVTRLRDGKAERVVVTLGPRETQTERVEVTKGIASGDVLVVGSAKGIAAGTPVKVIQ